MTRFPPIGEISSGTLRTEDLLDSFSWYLRRYGGAEYAALCDEAANVDPDSDEAADVLADLGEALNTIAAPYTYFGANEGDGSCFGFWPADLENFDELRVSDTSEIPDDYCGAVMHVNDHGNVTMYHADAGKLECLWSCV